MKNYELTLSQKDGLKKLLVWLESQTDSDLSGIVETSIEKLKFILVREYYTTLEKDLLNELRSQYVEEKVGKTK